MFLAGSLAHGQVYLRGNREAVIGVVQSVGVEGVRVNFGGDHPVEMVIGLDAIRSVEGSLSDSFAQVQNLADAAWRGRSRADRQDYAGAEPLLEVAAAKLKGNAGPTGAAVHESLLKCRLARGARGGAIESWLRTLECRQSPTARQDWLGPASEASAMLDARTALTPGLPPIWTSRAVLELSVAPLDELAGSENAKVAELAALYRAAALHEVGQSVLIPEGGVDDEGVRIVRDVVHARCGSPSQQVAARDRLQRRLDTPDIEPWLEAWLRVALGRSLTQELDPSKRRAGVLLMLHVPARLWRHAPELAALALAESATTMASTGDQLAALALADELARVAPSHQLLETPELRTIRGIRRSETP